MNSKLIRVIILLILLISFLIVLFSSIINIYENKKRIASFFSKKKIEEIQEVFTTKKELANDIISNGGYILLFRHAEREKWIDVKKYDSIEVLNNLKAENEYFSKAVCLNDRGLVQAKAMGEIIDKINLPYHIVVSSPSCRARQTAELVFGGYDYIKNVFMHYGPFDESKQFPIDVKNEILKIKTKENSNVIISAHNNVIRSPDTFDRIDSNINLYDGKRHIRGNFLEEGGFIVMKKENGKLVFIDRFYSFHEFYKQLFKRPKN